MRFNSSFYCGLLVLVGTAQSFPSLAESSDTLNQADLTQIPIEQLVTMDVLSASKIASQMSAAPSAVSIVTAEDIKAYGYRTLAEILESMRGLYITNDHAYSFLGGRGLGRPGDFTGRIMLLLDGNQVNNNIYNSAGLAYTGIIDPMLIERVEYVSGPGSTSYGNNAFFGIINIITKQGHDINGLQVVGEVSSYGGRDAKINYGKRLDNGAEVLLSASGFNSDGQNIYFPAHGAFSGGTSRNLDEQQSRRFFGKLELDSWFAEVAYSTRKKDIPTAPYGADFNAPYHYEDTSLQASVRHERQLTNALQMSLRTYYGDYEYRGLATYGTPWNEKSVGQWWGVNAQFVGTWFQNQRILLGAEFRNDFKQQISTPVSFLDTYEKTFSVYAQDEITINSRWMANLGARFDTSEDKSNNSTEKLSPRVALIYKPLDTTTLKLSWSTAFRRANPFEKYYTDGTLQSNPGLKPEQIDATELVIEHRFDKDTRLLGSVYHYQTHDYIRSVNNQFNNIRGGGTDGVELEFEKHWDNNVRLRTSAATQNAEDGNGDWQVNSPRRIGKMNISVPFLHRAWRAAFEMQAYSDRKTERNTSASGYSLANLTISNDKLLPNLGVSLGIRNLFDRDYDHVAPSSNDKQVVITQNGRSYWLRMIYDFK
ncbi:MAG: TonB-dependent receptor [Methylotenera sp.]|uniref:TonB-dependent receptor plug domain-containing protein n=1 Tax=Methylotenera sp. TaxID=2051956 RepID=UPI0027158526|nr:TonB-dependent receptor [Methylotenera sp.]MDO9150572.1 TonB-dependent receptor [Methylotenera sp.]